jgi:antitoxin (DNA-binding transcriptional repressor) of toxin-antitoxin stability system
MKNLIKKPPKKPLARNIIGLKDLRLNTSKYISKIKKGESFLVMQKSTPVFNISPVDEWGDEGVWKTLIDFTKIRKGGIPADELIERFEKFEKKYGQNR